MVGQSLWKNLKILVSIDQKLGDINNEIKQAEKILKKDQQEIPKIEAEIEEEKRKHLQARKDVDHQELIANDLKSKEEEKRKLLDKTSNQKEYAAIQKEIKQLVQKVSGQEDLLMKTWHQLENTKEKNELGKKEKEEKIVQLTEGVQAQLESLKDLEANQAKMLEERDAAKKIVPTEWIAKYESMRHRVEDPIVPVLGENCSACFYTILRQDLSRLKKSGVLLCRNCYRFLYYEAEVEQDAKKETF